jgi:hypothetical protein
MLVTFTKLHGFNAAVQTLRISPLFESLANAEQKTEAVRNTETRGVCHSTPQKLYSTKEALTVCTS